jgi:hypothetical protein
MKLYIMTGYGKGNYSSLAAAKRKGIIKSSAKAESFDIGKIDKNGNLLTTNEHSPADLSNMEGEQILIMK